MTLEYDIAIIGSGPAGLTAGFGLHYTGQRVVMIEKGHIGGDCTNTGCVPSKALIHYADTYTRHSPLPATKNEKKLKEDGAEGKAGKSLVQQALSYARSKRQYFRDEESADHFKKEHDLDVIHGHARFLDEHTLEVTRTPDPSKSNKTLSRDELSARPGKVHISAKKILICTGSHAFTPEIPLADQSKVYTNENIFEIEDDLTSLTIVGGGVIGCELGEAFAKLGVEVTLIQRNKDLIPREEPQARKAMKTLLERAGVMIHTSSTISGTQGAQLEITTKQEDGTTIKTSLPYTKILIAAGRRANISKLNLDKANVEYTKKGVLVNDTNQTNKKHIYALGDCVAGNPQFTHRADHEGRVLVRNIFFRKLMGPIAHLFKKSRTQDTVIPTVVYTTTEIASVGLTTDEIEKYYTPDEYRTYTAQVSSNDRHILDNEDLGFVTMHATRATGKILGVTMVMKNAGEMIHFWALAMQQGISAHKLMWQIYAYPTHISINKKVVRQFVTDTYKNIGTELKRRLGYHSFKIIGFLLRGLLIGAYLWYKSHTGLSNSELANHLIGYLSGSMAGPLIFMLGYTVRGIIFFPAVIMTLIGGILFGPIWGVIYVMIGENASASFSYWLGRTFGKSLIKPGSQGIFAKLSNLVKNGSLIDVFAARLVPMNFDIFNYFAGILKVPYMSYVLGTFLGILAPLIAVVLAGASLDVSQSFDLDTFSLNKTYLTIAVVLYVVSIGIAFFVKKMRKK